MLDEFVTDEFLNKFWDKERRENALNSLKEKFDRMKADPVFNEIIFYFYDRIYDMLNKSLQKFDENDIHGKISTLELSNFTSLSTLLWNSFKRGSEKRLDLDEESERVKKNYIERIKELGEERIRSLYDSLGAALMNFSNEMRGFLSIYACGKEVGHLISEGIIKASGQRIGDIPIQTYFCKLIVEDPILLSTELIQLLKPMHKFDLRNNLLIEFVGEWRKNPEGGCSILTRGLCKLGELESQGGIVSNQLKCVLPKILHNESDFQNVKSILSKMLVQREILELEIFRLMVNAGLPCIPKVEMLKPIENREGPVNFKKVGECDIFIQLEENMFIGLEVTLRHELENKIEKLRDIRDFLSSKGLNYDFCIVTNEAEKVRDLGEKAVELEGFRAESIFDIF